MKSEPYSFSDFIKKSILKAEIFTKVTFIDVILCLIISLLIGLFIFYIYRKTFRGVIYSHNFNMSLVLVSIITALIIKTISSNVVLSLGMVGALSIVRFRTALKEPLDIIYIFWAIAMGIATGAGVYTISIIGSLFIGSCVYFLANTKQKDEKYLLIVHYEETNNENVRAILDQISYKLKSKMVRNNEIELTVEVSLAINNTTFVNELSSLEGVKDAVLVNYNGDYAA